MVKYYFLKIYLNLFIYSLLVNYYLDWTMNKVASFSWTSLSVHMCKNTEVCDSRILDYRVLIKSDYISMTLIFQNGCISLDLYYQYLSPHWYIFRPISGNVRVLNYRQLGGCHMASLLIPNETVICFVFWIFLFPLQWHSSSYLLHILII